jgi:Tol biopolymer transport system component
MVLGFGRALAVGLVGLGAASFTSANGVHNAGITWSSGNRAIYGANVDGSRRHVLVPQIADGEGDPAWTRDGRALAFFGMFSDTSEIFVIRPDEPKYRSPIRWRCAQPFVRYAPPLKRWLRRARCRVLGSAANYRSREPTWSPDAKRIAVSEAWGRFGYPASTIKIVSLSTNKWTSVTKPRRDRFDVDPAWSPDGRTIAFARQDRGPPARQAIYLMRPDGSATRRLTVGGSPSWSPDGKRLAFALGGSIYEIRADGRGRRRIIRGLRSPIVRWSPDGRKLLYTSKSGNSADVWIADVEGAHPRRILHRANIEGIAWRPGS